MACLMATERLDYYAASIVAIVAFGLIVVFTSL